MQDKEHTESTGKIYVLVLFIHSDQILNLKVHLTPKYFFTTIHFCICLKRICLFFTIFAKS